MPANVRQTCHGTAEKTLRENAPAAAQRAFKGTQGFVFTGGFGDGDGGATRMEGRGFCA